MNRIDRLTVDLVVDALKQTGIKAAEEQWMGLDTYWATCCGVGVIE